MGRWEAVVLRLGTAVKLLWPAVNPGLAGRFGDLAPYTGQYSYPKPDNGRAPAGTTKKLPNSPGEKRNTRTGLEFSPGGGRELNPGPTRPTVAPTVTYTVPPPASEPGRLKEARVLPPWRTRVPARGEWRPAASATRGCRHWQPARVPQSTAAAGGATTTRRPPPPPSPPEGGACSDSFGCE